MNFKPVYPDPVTEQAEALAKKHNLTPAPPAAPLKIVDPPPPPSWPEPMLPENAHPDPMPGGLIRGPVGDMAAAVAAFTETPLELATGLALATVAACVQGKYEINIKPGYSEPLSLFIVVALDPGNRKSAVLDAILKPVMEWERDRGAELIPEISRIEEKNTAIESQIKKTREQIGKGKGKIDRDTALHEIEDLKSQIEAPPSTPQIFAQDVTVEHLGTLLERQGGKMSILSDEGGIFDILNGRYHKGPPNLDLVLQGHSGGPVRIDRGSRPPVHLMKTALTIGLSPQIDTLKQIGKNPNFKDRGLLARFGFLMPKSLIGYRNLSGTEIPGHVLNRYQLTIRRLLDANMPADAAGLAPLEIKMNGQAFEAWKEFYLMVEAASKPGGAFEYMMKGWAGKLPGFAARLAGLMAIMENEPAPLEVDREIMERALDLTDVFIKHAGAVFDCMGADESIEAARKIWAWAERFKQPEFDRRACCQALRGTFQTVEDMDPGFKVLSESWGLIRGKTIDTGRRRRLVYEINPDILEAWKNGMA